MPEPQPSAADERRHEPGGERLWDESWYFDFASTDGRLGGCLRLGLYPNLGVAWYWAYLVGDGVGLLTVKHHEARLPKGDVLEVREDGVWSAIHCETAHDHWSVGLEAFAVALDDPADAYAHADGRGQHMPLGFDLEWEAVAPPYTYPGVTRYEQPCRVTGDIAIGADRLSFDGSGRRDHSWGVRDWWRSAWVSTSGALDDGTRFHAVSTGPPGFGAAVSTHGYTVSAEGDALVPITSFTADTALDAARHDLPVETRMELDGLALVCTPLPHGYAPVRLDAPDGRIGRLPRALCRFTTTEGRGSARSGIGWTEWNQPPPPT
jgi:hypothetical protein